jgi:hypothetical protein
MGNFGHAHKIEVCVCGEVLLQCRCITTTDKPRVISSAPCTHGTPWVNPGRVPGCICGNPATPYDECPIHGTQFVPAPNLSQPEPAPVPNNLPAVWDLVIKDMQERDAKGLANYKVRLQPLNGRDQLIDLYQELLDAVVYTRALLYEREMKPKLNKELLLNRVLSSIEAHKDCPNFTHPNHGMQGCLATVMEEIKEEIRKEILEKL